MLLLEINVFDLLIFRKFRILWLIDEFSFLTKTANYLCDVEGRSLRILSTVDLCRLAVDSVRLTFVFLTDKDLVAESLLFLMQ